MTFLYRSSEHREQRDQLKQPYITQKKRIYYLEKGEEGEGGIKVVAVSEGSNVG